MTFEKREKIIKIRVTESEHEQLQQLKLQHHKNQLANWMRETCLSVEPKQRRDLPTVAPQLLRQLLAIGNNINQIARQINTSKNIGAGDSLQLIAFLNSIDAELHEIGAAHDSKI